MAVRRRCPRGVMPASTPFSSVLALALAMFPLASCGSDDDGPTSSAERSAAVPATPVTPPTNAAGATGCDGADGLDLGDDLQYREVGPDGRNFQLYVPPSYMPDSPAPLVLDFHPWQGDPSLEERFNGFEALSDMAGFVLARPQAVSTDAITGPSWDVVGTDDVAYVEAVLADIRGVACIDPARVYAVGMSQGGNFGAWLACRLPDTFAAIASVAVLDHPAGCDPAPIPILAFVGRDDTVYDLDKGLDRTIFESAANAPAGARPGGIEDEGAAWALTNGCDPVPEITDQGEGVERLEYRCPKRYETVIVIHGGGHVWPGSSMDPALAEGLGLGPVTEAIDATATISAFFERHRTH